jgi:hypothetical protein
LLTAGAFTLFGDPAIIWLAAEPSEVFRLVAVAALEDALVDAVLVAVLVVVLVVVLDIVLPVLLAGVIFPLLETAEASDAGRPLEATALETGPWSVATISGA